ncbi:hypothetical protein [Streptomyces erythrochromogenes]|uniref:hypothetical protein n=1 Tax=Streptomyces erythrochromogenes TaxID=285574 RepID=UPI0037D4E42F
MAAVGATGAGVVGRSRTRALLGGVEAERVLLNGVAAAADCRARGYRRIGRARPGEGLRA